MTRSKNDLKNKSVWDCMDEETKQPSSSAPSDPTGSTDGVGEDERDMMDIPSKGNDGDEAALHTDDVADEKSLDLPSLLSSSKPNSTNKGKEGPVDEEKDVADNNDDMDDDDEKPAKKAATAHATPSKHTSTKDSKFTTPNQKPDPTMTEVETQDDYSDKTKYKPEAEEDTAGDEEKYDLVEIISESDLINGTGPTCTADEGNEDDDDELCQNKAAVVYVQYTPSQNPQQVKVPAFTKKWYYCLDCQEDDYGGWPDKDELKKNNIPILSNSHLQLMNKVCSNRPDLSVPYYFNAPAVICNKSPRPTTTGKKNMGALVTPQPGGGGGSKNPVVVGMARFAHKAPSTLPGKGGKGGGAGKKKEMSKGTKQLMKKWTDARNKLGGKDELITQPTNKAKEMIFNLLKDQFRPLTVTEIHNLLKGVIPSAVLSVCLGAMSIDENKKPFADSDSEEEEGDDNRKKALKSKECDGKKSDANGDSPKDPYKLSVIFKAGTKNKSGNNGVYFLDYNLIPEMSRDERDELLTGTVQSEKELEALKVQMKKTNDSEKMLRSQPNNDELDKLLEEAASEMKELEEKVSEAKKHCANESSVRKIKQKIQTMASHWRKRKKLCLEFLNNMEEISEGTISRKKALNGDGSLALDSDENAIKMTIEMVRNKRQRLNMQGKSRGRPSTKTSATQGNPSFIGVRLSPQQRIERAYVNEENA